jgi:hypothetical protein
MFLFSYISLLHAPKSATIFNVDIFIVAATHSFMHGPIPGLADCPESTRSGIVVGYIFNLHYTGTRDAGAGAADINTDASSRK